MRVLSVALTASLLAAGPALAQSMANMPGMDHAAPAIKTGSGVGAITAIDAKTASITIRHGPIPAVGWPAMTMTFKANPPTLLRGLRVGQTVAFDVRTHGMNAEVTAVRPR